MTLVGAGWRSSCAVVFLAVSALWVRTYSVSDSYSWTAHPSFPGGSGDNFSTIPVREMVTTTPGVIVAHRQSPFG